MPGRMKSATVGSDQSADAQLRIIDIGKALRRIARRSARSDAASDWMTTVDHGGATVHIRGLLMLVIWGRNNSVNVQKVLWCCEEMALGYERTDAGGTFGVVNTPQYRNLNPNGLVPTIEDDGFVLWESNAIVRYLAAKHAAGSLWPETLSPWATFRSAVGSGAGWPCRSSARHCLTCNGGSTPWRGDRRTSSSSC